MGSAVATPGAGGPTSVPLRCESCANVFVAPLPSTNNESANIGVCCPNCFHISQVSLHRLTTPSGTSAASLAAAAAAAAARGTSIQAQSQSVLVSCPGCRRTLTPPAGAPRFRCPCGRILQMSTQTPGQHSQLSEAQRTQHSAMLQQLLQRQQQQPQLVRCPRCSIILQPPRDSERFRCPCGVVLSGTSWICNICRHSNSSRIQACVGCGNQRGSVSEQGDLNASLPLINAEGRLQRDSASKAFRLRRANQLNASRKQWKRRRDPKTGALSWMRNVDAEEAEQISNLDVASVQLESREALQNMRASNLKARLDALGITHDYILEKNELVDKLLEADAALEGMSIKQLKGALMAAGVSLEGALEKKDLVSLLRHESNRRGDLAVKGLEDKGKGNEGAWVRQLDLDGKLTWVAASEAKLGDGVAGTAIDSQDLEGAAGLPFDRKIVWFQSAVKMLRVPREQGVVKIQVNRNSLFEDAFRVFSSLNPSDFRRGFFFQFIGEEGLDYGGVSRELYTLLFQELFNVDFGLFAISASGNLNYTINPSSGLGNEHHLEYFHFAGQMLAKAIFDGHICPHHLSLPLYKHLLAWPVDMRDMQYVDPVIASSLQQLVETSDDQIEGMFLSFSATVSAFGQSDIVPLRGEGHDVDEPVTADNRAEYCHLLLKFYLLDRVNEQLGKFLQGFYEVIPQALISVFDFQELELLVCGLPTIDVVDWKQNTQYVREYAQLGSAHPVVKWFWAVVENFTDEQRARLLQFVTGSSRVPVQGFSSLQGNDGNVRLFTIDSIPFETSIFPRAHTCFNRIDLPLYNNSEELKEYLSKAIQMELTGFGLE